MTLRNMVEITIENMNIKAKMANFLVFQCLSLHKPVKMKLYDLKLMLIHF